MTRQLSQETGQTESFIDSHRDKLVSFSENFFENLKNKKLEIVDRLEEVENEVDRKMDFIEQMMNQISQKKEGVFVEERLNELKQVRQWASNQVNLLEDANGSEDLAQQISLDANLIVKNPTDLQEAVHENMEIISTTIIFFGEFNKIMGYRPDIDYWFNAKANMDLTHSSKQYSFMDGLKASLVFHNKIIFTGAQNEEIIFRRIIFK